MFKNISLLDWIKSIAVLSIVVFIWFYGSKVVNYLKPNIHPATATTVIKLDDGMIKLAAAEASNKLADKLREEMAAENSALLKAFNEQKKKTNEVLTELGRVKGQLKQTTDLINRKPDHVYTSTNKPENTQEFKKIYAKDAKGNAFPIAWGIYYPNEAPDSRWKTGTYPLDFDVTIIESENRNGTFNRYAELYASNERMEETKGKKFNIQLNSIDWQKYEISEKKFSFWNPRIALGLGATADGIIPSLNISPFSYGKTNSDMDWRFLTMGVGYNEIDDKDTAVFYIEPFSWNIGKALPLIENFFIGPMYTIDTNANHGGGLQISVPF